MLSRRPLALVLIASLTIGPNALAEPVGTPPKKPDAAPSPKSEPKKADTSADAKPDAKAPKRDPKKSDAERKSPDGRLTVPDEKKIARSVTAIVDIAAALDTALPPLDGHVLVGVAPLASDVAAPRAKALSVTIGQVFAGKRRFEGPTEPESFDVVRGRAHGVRAIVYLTPRIVNGELVVSADVFPVPRTVWARIRNPSPGPFAHAFAKAFIDAEVRSHLEAVPITAFDATRGRNFESGVLALACDDFDRDGAPEIVSMSRKSITVSRIRAGRVEPIATHLWSDLSSAGSAPLREAIGFAIPVRASSEPLAPRGLVASITDRALAVELDSDFDLTATFLSLAVPDGDAFACARLPAITVTGPLTSCRTSDEALSRPSIGGRYDAFASAKLVSPDGKPFVVSAGREDGGLEVFDDAGHHVTIPHVGAQLAVGDIDQDGVPEIFTSLDVASGLVDALVVYSWPRTEAKAHEIVRMPLAAGVHAIATCPPESAKRAPFLVATSDEIVVLR